jgi:hypothetical protein
MQKYFLIQTIVRIQEIKDNLCRITHSQMVLLKETDRAS